MINPGKTHKTTGIVIALTRSKHFQDVEFKVRLDNGTVLPSHGFIYHKSLKIGDRVNCDVRFSITSDEYGIRGIRRTRRN